VIKVEVKRVLQIVTDRSATMA